MICQAAAQSFGFCVATVCQVASKMFDFAKNLQKNRTYALTKGMIDTIIDKNDRGAHDKSTVCGITFAKCCSRKRGLRRRKRGDRFPGNSKNIRFTVAICGELSNIEFSGCVRTTLDCSD